MIVISMQVPPNPSPTLPTMKVKVGSERIRWTTTSIIEVWIEDGAGNLLTTDLPANMPHWMTWPKGGYFLAGRTSDPRRPVVRVFFEVLP